MFIQDDNKHGLFVCFLFRFLYQLSRNPDLPVLILYLYAHCLPVSVFNPRSAQGIDERHVDLEVLQSRFSCGCHSQRTSELRVGELFC